MKFIIEKEKLLEPLRQLSQYASNISRNLILFNILLILHDSWLTLVVTNLDVEITYKIQLSKKDIYQDGSITVNVRKLYELCRSFLNKSKISFYYNNNRLSIRCVNNISYFSVLSPEDFPLFQKIFTYHYQFVINSNLLKIIITSIYLSMSKDNISYHLNGIYIKYIENFFIFIATDGHRISFYKLYLVNIKIQNKNNFFSIVLSRKLVIELLKLIHYYDDIQIVFEIYHDIIKIYFNEYTIYSKLMKGEYPDYNTLLLSSKYVFLDLDIFVLKQALLRMSIITSVLFNYVKLKITKNILYLSINSTDNNEIKEKIDILYNYSEIIICLNIQYLLDIVNIIKHNTIIRMYIKDNFSLVHIYDLNNPYLYNMIMPIQL